MIVEYSLAALVAGHVADFNIRVIDSYSPSQWEANACIVILAHWRTGVVKSVNRYLSFRTHVTHRYN